MTTDPALAAALQALAGTISGLPQAIIAANAAAQAAGPGRGAGREKTPGEKADRKDTPDGSALGTALKPLMGLGAALAAKFAAVIGPLAVLGAVLSSTSSGFSTLQKAAQVFATSLGPVLLPVTALLATAFVTMSDVVMAALGPGLQGFFSIIMGIGIPVLVQFVDILLFAADKLGEWAKALKDGEEVHNDAVDDTALAMLSVVEVFEDVGDAIESIFQSSEEAAAQKAERAQYRAGMRQVISERPAQAAQSPGRKLVMGALNDVVKSFSLSAGPKAQISGLEGVGKAAQLAALNQDPLEARMLQTQQKISQMMETVVAQMGQKNGVFTPKK